MSEDKLNHFDSISEIASDDSEIKPEDTDNIATKKRQEIAKSIQGTISKFYFYNKHSL